MIIGPKTLQSLAHRYMGIGRELTRDESEILLCALYFESENRGGMIAEALKKVPVVGNVAKIPKPVEVVVAAVKEERDMLIDYLKDCADGSGHEPACQEYLRRIIRNLSNPIVLEPL